MSLSLLLLEEAKHAPASGPLYLLIFPSEQNARPPASYQATPYLHSGVVCSKSPYQISSTWLPYIKRHPSLSLCFLLPCFIFLHKISLLSPPDIFLVIFVFICLPIPECKVRENRGVMYIFFLLFCCVFNSQNSAHSWWT